MAKEEILSKEVLEKAAILYGLHGGRQPSSGGFENIVYEFAAPVTNAMIRFTPYSQASLSLMQAEVDFIGYLHRHGGPVPGIISSENGNVIERIGSRSREYVVVAFEKARGIPAATIPVAQWTPDLLQKLGSLMGTLHRLAVSYIPPEGIRRPEWDEDEFYYPEKYIPDQPRIVEKSRDIFNRISALPRDPGSYGLIHGDMNLNNLYVNHGRITLLDFDDSRYGWFAHDIAVALFFWLMDLDIREKETYAQLFLDNIITGYEHEYTLDAYWWAQIPLFLDLHVLLCYTVIAYECDLENLNGWCQRFMKNRKYDIENDIPFVSLESWFQQRIKGRAHRRRHE